MKLAAKLVLLFLGCLGLVVGVFSYLSMQQAQDLSLAEHERHAADLAATLQASLRASPRPLEAVERDLSGWSREVQYVQVRLVNPHQHLEPGRRPSVPAELWVTATELTTILHEDASGQRMMYTYVPLDDTSGCQLEVAAPESYLYEQLSRSLKTSAIALLAVSSACTLVILFGGLWMVGRPLEKLVEKVQRVGQGDLSRPVELNRGDELGRLGLALNLMCEQLDQQHKRIESEMQQRISAVEQLRHADRLRTVGRLAAGLAHEIGTPLNVMSGRAELIAGGRLSPAEVTESAKTIKAQSQRIATIVQELLNFARCKTPQRQQVDLNDVLQETLELLRPMADKRQVGITLVPPSQPASANVDAARIQQVLTNLIVNAIHATADRQPAGSGEIQAELVHETNVCPPSDLGDQAGDYWKIRISDNGVGIPAEVLDDIFEPFFTTKDVGEGTGLGLSISYGIMREHAGWIDVQSQEDVGSTFAVYIPCDVERPPPT